MSYCTRAEVREMVKDDALNSIIGDTYKLIILFCTVGSIPCAKHFKFSQQEKVICCGRYIGSIIRTAARVVCVFGGGFHHGPKIGRQSGHQASANRVCGGSAITQYGFSHVASVPPAAVGVALVHPEAIISSGIIVL